MCLTRHRRTFVLCFFLSVLCCQLVFVNVHPLTKTWHVRWRNPSSAYLTVFLLLLSPDTHTHAHSPNAADTIVQVIVISAAQVEKCLFKVRTACVYEDNDTRESLEYRFCASLKAPLCACWIVCVPCVLQCVSVTTRTGVSDCVSARPCLCVFCVRVCARVHTHRWESAGSGVCLVSRWSGNPRAQITAGVVCLASKGPRG